jgi:hypothetical protein
MSNILTEVAIALVLTIPLAAPFAGMAGEAGAGNVPVSGIPPGPAGVGDLNNINVNPSGIGNASRLPPLPKLNLGVPQFK